MGDVDPLDSFNLIPIYFGHIKSSESLPKNPNLIFEGPKNRALKIFDVKNQEPVFEQLDILLADKAKYPTKKSILNKLGYDTPIHKGSGTGTLTPILEAYAKNRNITIPADRFPIGRCAR